MTSLPTSAVLLGKSVVGAATASLPSVLATLGAPLGAGLLILLSAASAASTGVVLTRIRTAPGAPSSYQGAVLALLGPPTAALLDSAAVLFGWGMLVVYCGMVADTLVGPAGLACSSSSSTAGGGSRLWCSRGFTIPALAAAVFFPLSTARSLSESAAAAWAGAVAVGVWAVIGVGSVAWAAATGGRLFSLPLMPDAARLAVLGGWTEETVAAAATHGPPAPPATPPTWRLLKGCASAAGIVTSALVTQLTAPPVAGELAPPRSAAREGVLVWSALSGCVLAYLSVALPALALLGRDGVKDDLLDNWTAAALAPAFGQGGFGGAHPHPHPPPPLAVLAAGGVRAAFAGALISMFPLMMWPTREAAGRLWVSGVRARERRRGGGGGGDGEAPLLEEGGGEGGAAPPPPPLLTGRAFLAWTAGLTASAAAVALAFPNNAAALAVVGAGAGAVVAFFIPAALCGASGNTAGAVGLAVVGCSMVGAVL